MAQKKKKWAKAEKVEAALKEEPKGTSKPSSRGMREKMYGKKDKK